MKAVLYVKKESPYLYENVKCLKDVGNEYYTYNNNKYLEDKTLNGKIVAECEVEIEDIVYKHIHERDQIGILHNEAWYEYKGLNVTHYECDLASRSGFKDDDSLFDYLFDYLRDKEGYSQDGKAIHISNVNVFDETRELSEFYQVNNCCFEKEVGKDWEGLPIYACVFRNACKYQSDGHTCDKYFCPLKHIHNMSKVFDDRDCEWKYIISLSPQEACNVLNHEQDVLVRRNVLKEMLK